MEFLHLVNRLVTHRGPAGGLENEIVQSIRPLTLSLKRAPPHLRLFE
jgi:hypothetical protein